MRIVCVLVFSLLCPGLIGAQEALRLTDQPTEKPCIVVSARGTHVAWMEAREEPAPVNLNYWVRLHDIQAKVTTDVLCVPGIRSNLKMKVLVGDKTTVKGPNFKESDLNYRNVGDSTQVRLSGDGRYLAICIEEHYNYTMRTPFFVLVDLKEETFETIPVHIPDGLGTISGGQITSRMNLMHWDFSPAGTHLAYVLDAVNYRGSTVVLYDIKAKTGRRVLGYERASYVNGTLTLEGPADQRLFYGKRLRLGDNRLVISGKNQQGQEGLWIASLQDSALTWHAASFATPGLAGDHVFYSSQTPAVWLNADGTEGTVFEQQNGINNQAALPFWSGAGSAYVTDPSFSSVLQLGAGEPQSVLEKSQLDVPESWQFRIKGTSSADSYQLVSETGGTLVLPMCDPKDGRKFDLFLVTRDLPDQTTRVTQVEDSSTEFSSLVDAFDVGSLLKPGELPRQFMPAGVSATGLTLPPLPPAWNAKTLSAPDPMAMPLSDTAERAHAEAQMQLMLGDLNDATLSAVIERLEKAVDLAPKNRPYRLDLAGAYVAANTMLSVGAGIEQYCLLLKDNKRDDAAMAGLADAYLQLGNVDQALEMVYLRTVQNPEKIEIRRSAALQMAVYAIETGDRVGCVTWLRQIYEQYPKDSFVQSLIGLVWQFDGDSDRAEAIFNRILKESPPDDPIRTHVGYLKRALIERRSQS